MQGFIELPLQVLLMTPLLLLLVLLFLVGVSLKHHADVFQQLAQSSLHDQEGKPIPRGSSNGLTIQTYIHE